MSWGITLNIGKENQLLSTNIIVEIENQEVEGLITYSLDQLLFKFKVNSGNNLELWGVNAEMKSYEQKWTIHGIHQHMGFDSSTENPCVMMRENHKTKSSASIVICQDDLYIVSAIPEEILHMFQDKYKINNYLQGECQSSWKKYLSNQKEIS